MRAINNELTRRINDQEIYSRRENLIIRGLPEQSHAETTVRSSEGSADDILQPGSSSSVEQTVVTFCRDKLKLDIGLEDISAAHRLNMAGKDTTRPIIVRFTSLKVRDKIIRSKKILRDSRFTPVYISDHRTGESSKLFFDARALVRTKKLASTWTMNGRVYYKLTAAFVSL